MADRPYEHYSEAELLHTLNAYEREKKKQKYVRQNGPYSFNHEGYKELEAKHLAAHLRRQC